MNLIQIFLSNLSKKMQVIAICVPMVLFLVLLIYQTLQDNSSQKQVNQRLVSGQEFDVNTLLTSAQIICIVPPKSFIYHEGEIKNYLTNNKVKQLNRKLMPVWRMFVDEWHLVGISDNAYQYYRMGDFILPEYIGTKCLSVKEYGKVSIALTDVGSREFYIIQKGRSSHHFLNGKL